MALPHRLSHAAGLFSPFTWLETIGGRYGPLRLLRPAGCDVEKHASLKTCGILSKKEKEKEKEEGENNNKRIKRKRGPKGVPPETGPKIVFYTRTANRNRNEIEPQKKSDFKHPTKKKKKKKENERK